MLYLIKALRIWCFKNKSRDNCMHKKEENLRNNSFYILLLNEIYIYIYIEHEIIFYH